MTSRRKPTSPQSGPTQQADAPSRKMIKPADKALNEERERFYQIAATLPGAIYSFRMRSDGTTHFPYASPRIQEIYGFSPEELAEDATGIRDRIHPDDLPGVQAGITASAHDLLPCHQEMRVLHPDRGLIWIERHSTPTREPDGSTLWHGFVTDITERKRAEAERTYIMESARCLLWSADVVADENGKLLWTMRYFDEEAAQRLVPIEAPSGDPYIWKWHEVRFMEDRERNYATGEQNVRASQDYRDEFRMHAADGSVHWLQEDVHVHTLEAGRRWHLVGICTDITEYKEATAALRESETRLQQALINARQGLWDWNIATGQVYRDTNWHLLLGYLPGEIDTRHETWAETIHPEDRPRVSTLLKRHLASDAVVYDVDYRARHKSGAWIWLNTRGRYNGPGNSDTKRDANTLDH